MTFDEQAIECRKLTKTYGDTEAVMRLDLDVARGEVFGLLGPNGAGKTTTIMMLLGLTEPTSGSVRVLGLDPTRQALEAKRRIGYLPDSVGFYGDMTARQNLEYTARLNHLSRREGRQQVDELLEVVGLTERAADPVEAFSHGMNQRLGIADALVKSPEVLILDEPTMGLDPKAADEVLAMIQRLAADRHVTVLLSSHQLTQVQTICHRVGIFVRGRLVASGTIDELAASHGGRVTIEVGVAEPQDAASHLRQVEGVVDVEPYDGGWLVGAQHDVRNAVAGQLRSAGMTPIHLRQRPEELAHIYRRYFTEGSDVVATG